MLCGPHSRTYLKSSHIEMETFMAKTFSHERLFVFVVKMIVNENFRNQHFPVKEHFFSFYPIVMQNWVITLLLLYIVPLSTLFGWWLVLGSGEKSCWWLVRLTWQWGMGRWDERYMQTVVSLELWVTTLCRSLLGEIINRSGQLNLTIQ